MTEPSALNAESVQRRLVAPREVGREIVATSVAESITDYSAYVREVASWIRDQAP
jgi:hypothetical protein